MSKPVVLGQDIGSKVMKALGLEGRSIKSIGIRIAVDELVTCEVVENIEESQAGELVEVLKTYGLVELAPKPQGDSDASDAKGGEG